jgi:leucyl/phenylalanyl-tRNA--protein transferase
MARYHLFPDVLQPDATGLVARGGTLTAETVIEAHHRGIFPWSGENPIPWCAPNPRLVLFPDRFAASRSLRKLDRRASYDVVYDTNFLEVIHACAAIPRPGQDGTWITPNLIDVYVELHERGIAHSVEVRQNGTLVGGLYGLTFGKAFFGDSMFHVAKNTSKLALRALTRRLSSRGFHFIDCQAVTLHLLSLGAMPVPLERYIKLLNAALSFPSEHHSWRVA